MHEPKQNLPPDKNCWKTGKLLLTGLILSIPLLTSCSTSAMTSAVALQPVMETLLAPALNSVVLPALNTALVPDLDARALTELKNHNVTPDSAPFLWYFLDSFVTEEEKAAVTASPKKAVSTVKTHDAAQ